LIAIFEIALQNL